jgi:hypothetical protein
MRTKLLIAAAIVIGMSGSAFGRNYYVVQNTVSHKCSVLPKKPKGKTVVLVPGASTYKTRGEARAALATLAACRL